MNNGRRIKFHAELCLIADPVRMAIIEKLLSGPKHVKAICNGLPVTISAVSQQLATLKEAGMISQRRHGRFVIYSAVPAAMDRLMAQLDTLRDRIVLHAAPASAGTDEQRLLPDLIDDQMNAWLGQWEGHDSLTVGMLTRLRLISHLLQKILKLVTSRFDLNSNELHVLGLIDRMGSHHECTLSELSKNALVSLPSISKHLNRLEAKGLILRLPNAKDGRSNLIRLSDMGREKLRKIMDFQRITYFYHIYQMPKEKLATIAGMTREILKVFQRSN